MNEAFAAVALAAMRDAKIPREKQRGARILVTLMDALEARNLKRGLAAICIGGGEAAAMIVERVWFVTERPGRSSVSWGRRIAMRLRLAVAAALLLSASSLLAQNRKTEISVFASDPGYAESGGYGSTVTGGVGLALNQWWTSQISTEFSVTAERHYTFTDAQRMAVYRYPIDALAQYHFLNGTRWQPYIGIGARSADRVTPVINAGVMLQLSQHFDLRFDGRMTEDHATDFHDSLAKFSIGLGWRF